MLNNNHRQYLFLRASSSPNNETLFSKPSQTSPLSALTSSLHMSPESHSEATTFLSAPCSSRVLTDPRKDLSSATGGPLHRHSTSLPLAGDREAKNRTPPSASVIVTDTDRRVEFRGLDRIRLDERDCGAVRDSKRQYLQRKSAAEACQRGDCKSCGRIPENVLRTGKDCLGMNSVGAVFQGVH